MPNWVESQRNLCEKLVNYITKKKLKAVILQDGRKPYVRIFFSKKIFYDCHLKSVKSHFVQNVWLVPKMFFNRDVHYVVYDEKREYFYIMNGTDIERVAKEELSTYAKKLVYLVVPMPSFLPIHVWIRRRKREAEKRLQKRISDF